LPHAALILAAGARISRPSSRFAKVPVMARTNPVQFVQQVRAEVGKVVWPSRREVMLTTVMVFIMAALTATFFSLVDFGIRQALSLVLNSFG
jgi:preprotein translocase subunit SecE